MHPAGRLQEQARRGLTFVVALRQFLVLALLSVAALAAAAAAFDTARAQGKLEAHYWATLAGIPIGKGDWVVEIGDSDYSASASGVTTGLIRVFTGGEGTSAV